MSNGRPKTRIDYATKSVLATYPDGKEERISLADLTDAVRDHLTLVGLQYRLSAGTARGIQAIKNGLVRTRTSDSLSATPRAAVAHAISETRKIPLDEAFKQAKALSHFQLSAAMKVPLVSAHYNRLRGAEVSLSDIIGV